MTKYWSVAVALLAACATTRYGEKITQAKFQFASYSIDAPKGEWGISKIDEAAEEIEFAFSRSYGTAGVVQVTALAVKKKLIKTTEEVGGKPFKAEDDQMLEVSEDLFAQTYFAVEQKAVEETERTTNEFSVKKAQTGVETVGGKTLYFLRHSVDYREPRRGG
jgi:hypothetical protein